MNEYRCPRSYIRQPQIVGNDLLGVRLRDLAMQGYRRGRKRHGADRWGEATMWKALGRHSSRRVKIVLTLIVLIAAGETLALFGLWTGLWRWRRNYHYITANMCFMAPQEFQLPWRDHIKAAWLALRYDPEI